MDTNKNSGPVYLGVELGSTRIKAVGIDQSYVPVLSGDYTWKSDFTDGVWTYPMEKVWIGLKCALEPFKGTDVKAVGISAMMHGYLAFDKDWTLLTPFRTWQNTMTETAAQVLTELFGFNIPQRWSIAHLYQAILNGEPHVKNIAHITTLAGYVHYMLTGVNALGIGDASGMFPIDSNTHTYNEGMLNKFDDLISGKGLGWKIRDILPNVLVAGKNAGTLTKAGAELLGGILEAGVPFAPCEGDAGTGMTATNAVRPCTGNVSTGTSIFSMVVLDKLPSSVHSEIDIVTTPTGAPAAMVHCNNCTMDMNSWVGIIGEGAELFADNSGLVDMGTLYTKLYKKSLEGDPDCGGVVVMNYLSGEGVTHMDSGVPMVIHSADAKMSLANFIRANLYSTMTTLKIGMDILSDEGVTIKRLMGHGGLFKTPVVGQKYMAAATKAPITCMETAGEGGPYGMAILAAFTQNGSESLEDFLDLEVFDGTKAVTIEPDSADVTGFDTYIENFKKALKVEKIAVEIF